MKKQEFITFMDNAIKKIQTDEEEYSCCSLSWVKKSIDKGEYTPNFPLRNSYASMFDCEDLVFSEKITNGIRLPEFVKEVRLIALELFKQVVLETKEYENF